MPAFITRNVRKTIISQPQYYPCSAELYCDSTVTISDKCRAQLQMFYSCSSTSCYPCLRMSASVSVEVDMPTDGDSNINVQREATECSHPLNTAKNYLHWEILKIYALCSN